MKFKKVTKKEFESFIKSYKNRLEVDTSFISEPPLRSFNDFSDGLVWPESMVAKIKMEFRGDEAEYFILENCPLADEDN